MNKGMENIIALNSFRDCLSVKKPYGDGCKFFGTVSYYSQNDIITENLDVFIIFGGREPSISLDIFEEGKIIKGGKFHFTFYPLFENILFQFDEKLKILTISGDSKTIGSYKVMINEPVN